MTTMMSTAALCHRVVDRGNEIYSDKKEWELFEKETKNKLDVMLFNNRITEQEYEDLSKLIDQYSQNKI